MLDLTIAVILLACYIGLSINEIEKHGQTLTKRFLPRWINAIWIMPTLAIPITAILALDWLLALKRRHRQCLT